MPVCVRSSNDFTRRLECHVRYPALPQVVDGLFGAAGLGLTCHALGPVAWWPALVGLPLLGSLLLRRIRRMRGSAPRLVVLTADGLWSLHRADDAGQVATLRAAWLAGPACGLSFVAEDGRHWRVYLLAWWFRPDDWRRLRVRLRLPQMQAMT